MLSALIQKISQLLQNSVKAFLQLAPRAHYVKNTETCCITFTLLDAHRKNLIAVVITTLNMKSGTV